MANLWVRKPLSQLLAQAGDSEKSLKRTLGSWNLVLLGIGAIIGAGLFVRTAAAAGGHAGAAVTLSFIVAAVGCAFAGLCYAEFASMIPIAGSAYTYAYATMGELVAWIIGWALILEYAIGNIVVAISWSGYFNNLLVHVFNINLPSWMLVDPVTAGNAFTEASNALAAGNIADPAKLKSYQFAVDAYNNAPVIGGNHIFFNLPAFFVVALITWLTYNGI